MRDKTIENLMNINTGIALIFIIIIRGNVGFVGGIVFGVIAIGISLIGHKRGMFKKNDSIEKIFVIGLGIIGIPLYYLYAVIELKNSDIMVLLIALSLIWLYGGLAVLYFRKRRRER